MLALVHPRLGRGGSEARALWAIEALKDAYDVTLITGGPVDLRGLNRFYGTSLGPGDFDVLEVPQPGFVRNTARFAALRGCLYQRFCRRVAGQFDVLISAYNACDFGVPAIQCIADFAFDDELRRSLHPLPPGPGQWLYRDGIVRRAYLGLSRRLSRPSGRKPLRDDIVIANSHWTAGIIRRRYGGSPSVLYPPVEDGFPQVPPEKKENGFVCIGRIAPEKRIERMVEILSRVRQAGHDVHLHVIGQIGPDAYGRVVRSLCDANRRWIIPEGRLEGPAKKAMLAAHRYGIHGCQGEAFGIAVAEMVKAGCITFVPAEGGQAEIVNHDGLTYSSVEEAAAKIGAVLKNAALQEALRLHLSRQAGLFGVEVFKQGIREAVARFLAEKAKGARTADVMRGESGSSPRARAI